MKHKIQSEGETVRTSNNGTLQGNTQKYTSWKEI